MGRRAYDQPGIYNTSERIVAALNMFSESICEPTAIQSNVWDARGLGRLQRKEHANLNMSSFDMTGDRCGPIMSMFSDFPETYYNNTLVELAVINKWIAGRKSKAVVLMRTSSFFPDEYTTPNNRASLRNFGMYYFAQELNKQVVDIGQKHAVHVFDR